MALRPESIDLARVAGELARTFAGKAPVGYLLGKTALRDAVTELLECSQLEGEQLVDTMVARGFLRYEGASSADIDDLQPWLITAKPRS